MTIGQWSTEAKTERFRLVLGEDEWNGTTPRFPRKRKRSENVNVPPGIAHIVNVCNNFDYTAQLLPVFPAYGSRLVNDS